MLYQQIIKSMGWIIFLLGCASVPIDLNAASWSPIPPASITGAGATNIDDTFTSIVTTYNASNQTIVATWLDINNIPTYAVWNGSSWTTPATNIPGASALNSNAIPFYSTYNPSNDTIITTWTDASNNPIYTIWNGSSWTTPAIIPGGSDASFFSVYTTYDAANQTVVAVWADQSGNPIYAVLSGNSWTTTATIIPGGFYVDTVVLSTYDAGNQTIIATWVNTNSNPTYAIWNGSSWIAAGTIIPNAGTVSSVLTVTPIYDPANQSVLVTWIESVSSTSYPTYAILNGTSWTVPATQISNTSSAEGMFFSTYDAANQTIMTTWLDETETLMYAIWDGSSWTPADTVPGSVDNSFLLLEPVYDPESETIIAAWLGLGTGSTLTPAYAVWNGSSWAVPTTAIPGANAFNFSGEAPFFYETYDPATQTVMVTWVDTSGIPTYAVYTSSSNPPISGGGCSNFHFHFKFRYCRNHQLLYWHRRHHH